MRSVPYSRSNSRQTPRLDRRDGVDFPAPIDLDHPVDGVREGDRIGEEAREIVEEDARLGKIGGFPNGAVDDRIVVHTCKYCRPSRRRQPDGPRSVPSKTVVDTPGFDL